jgi:prepilin-type N-terminal cleavage/methylation domain-containing protein
MKHKKGFTLTECVIAIAVFSILSMIIASLLNASLTSHRNNLNDTRSLREQRSMLTRGIDADRGASGEAVSFSFGGGVDITYNLTPKVASNALESDAALSLHRRGLELTRFAGNHGTNNRMRDLGFVQIDVSFRNQDSTGSLLPGLEGRFQLDAPPHNNRFPGSASWNSSGTNGLVRSAWSISTFPDVVSGNDPVEWTPLSISNGISTARSTNNVYANILEIRVDGQPFTPRDIAEYVEINIPHSQISPRMIAVIPEAFDRSNVTIQTRNLPATSTTIVDTIKLTRHEGRDISNGWFQTFRIAIITEGSPIDDFPAWLGLQDEP